MMGCCPPEGMHGLWEAYLAVVEEKDGAVWVNMNLHREHPAATVVAYRPEHGRMEVRAHKGGRYMLRPPAWAPREKVKLQVATRGAARVSPHRTGPVRRTGMFRSSASRPAT